MLPNASCTQYCVVVASGVPPYSATNSPSTPYTYTSDPRFTRLPSPSYAYVFVTPFSVFVAIRFSASNVAVYAPISFWFPAASLSAPLPVSRLFPSYHPELIGVNDPGDCPVYALTHMFPDAL